MQVIGLSKRTLLQKPRYGSTSDKDRASLDLAGMLQVAKSLLLKNVSPEFVVCKDLQKLPITWELIEAKISSNSVEFFQTDFIEFLMSPEDFGTLFMKDANSFDVPIDYEKVGKLNTYVQSLEQGNRDKMISNLETVIVVHCFIKDRALSDIKATLRGREELDKAQILQQSKMMEETQRNPVEKYSNFINRRKILGRYLALLLSLNFFWDCNFVGAIQNSREYLQIIIDLLRKEHQNHTVYFELNFRLPFLTQCLNRGWMNSTSRFRMNWPF